MNFFFYGLWFVSLSQPKGPVQTSVKAQASTLRQIYTRHVVPLQQSMVITSSLIL